MRSRKPASTHAPGRLTPAFACAQAIKQGLAPNAPIMVVGPEDAESHAVSCGLSVHRRIASPIGMPRLGRPALRSLVGGVDRIICWSDELIGMATGIAEHAELISTAPHLCTVPARKIANVSCLTDHDASIWADRGIVTELLKINPGVLRQQDQRETARELLGIAPETLVFIAIADQPEHADARGLVFLMTVLDATKFRVQAIIPKHARNAAAARRHHRAIGNQYPLWLSERTPLEWLRVADLAALPASDGSGSDLLLELMCESQGCPVIRLDSGGTARIGPDGTGEQSLLEELDELVQLKQRARTHGEA
ncbi:MAG: hypothetical protein AB8F26_10285 [Phycisphaerales bacterium]